MTVLTTYEAINKAEWGALIAHSQTATWFQTPEAYLFFAGQPELFTPFVFAVGNGQISALCTGYITRETNALKHFFTRRAIIIGGPVIADNASQDEVRTLLLTVRNALKTKAIYIETRNFNDFSTWREAFTQAGFHYEPHLNFHVDTTSLDCVNDNLSKNRKRDILTSLRDGVTILEQPTLAQVIDFYRIIQKLYSTKVKTPLFPQSFFEQLYNHPQGRFLLVELNGQIISGIAAVELPKKCLYEWFVAGMDGTFKHIFPSSVATYAGLRYAAEHHIPRFDMMGAGTPDNAYGVRDFKARFGGKEVEHGRFKYIANPLLYKLGEWGVKILKKK
ncbi:MAG: peptidoglycan bridge formation glycyltransferase FemA/FemB family protein [Paludibacteraceae bacterium]|nr:peptidoglycan bridge formation glycyltransferase FemA/FemB family protein [Paludibacteraceae bacterium]